MVNRKNYTPKEIESLYEVIENAVENHTSIDMRVIVKIIKPGDFYLFNAGANGLLFIIDGIKWIENGIIYSCLIQPQNTNDVIVRWYPVITINDRDYSSSGILSMINKENRSLRNIREC